MEFIQKNQTKYTKHSNNESWLNLNHFVLGLIFATHTLHQIAEVVPSFMFFAFDFIHIVLFTVQVEFSIKFNHLQKLKFKPHPLSHLQLYLIRVLNNFELYQELSLLSKLKTFLFWVVNLHVRVEIQLQKQNYRNWQNFWKDPFWPFHT